MKKRKRSYEISRREALTSKNTTSANDSGKSTAKRITTIGSHGSLDDLQWLSQSSDFEHVQAGSQQQVGELDGLLLHDYGLCSDGGHDGMRLY